MGGGFGVICFIKKTLAIGDLFPPIFGFAFAMLWRNTKYFQAHHSHVFFFFVFLRNINLFRSCDANPLLGSPMEGILHNSHWGVKNFYFPNFFVFPRFVLKKIFFSLSLWFPECLIRAVNLEFSFTPPHINWFDHFT